MQKVLVAGATGYLGRFVTKELKQRGYWIRALVRNPEKLGQTGQFLQPAVAGEINDLFVGEVTKPHTLKGLCKDIDIVFSSIGITRQKDRFTHRDVDYHGNKNVLDIAVRDSVSKFIYVSVFNAELYEYLAIVKAHEDFVRYLKKRDIDHTVVRTSGFFSDMSEFLGMARKGRIYLVGSGKNRINPIHGADLAKVCVDAITLNERDIPIGGPETYTTKEIAELAFSTLGKKSKITKIPPILASLVAGAIRPFNKKTSDLVKFFVAAWLNDGVAPSTGRYNLGSYYKELACQWTEGN